MSEPNFRIVLVEPEIPQNTGNIGRTCVGAGAELHLVGKLGFEISDRHLRRAGLDYWQHLTWYHHASFEDWMSCVSDPNRVHYFSAKAKRSLFQVKFQRGDWLVFGKETKGLDPDLLRRNEDRTVLIPQYGPIRGFNLATAVAIGGFEGLRQLGESNALSC
ncbi:MAG: tRNA (cytidine(34)-2'-O)-methyltransferase [Bdellovibrionaceae bacterium]|nr:tRNA (cytidine(34)-2'-O)-methyltransferase [Pseudobdellovibrionaceae bacterium]